jgi:hypothetical protein
VIIGITGYKRSGKNTVADVLAIDFDFTVMSFADKLYRMLNVLNPNITARKRIQDLVAEFGWDLAKETFPEVRRLLQTLGTECVRDILGAETWVDAWEKSLPHEPRRIVAADVRFPNEVVRIRALGGTIWRVTRPGTAPDGHRSETDQQQIVADATLHNNGTIEDLQAQVRRLVQAEVGAGQLAV